MGKIEIRDQLNGDSLTNASLMLEAALNQMDDILSGTYIILLYVIEFIMILYHF